MTSNQSALLWAVERADESAGVARQIGRSFKRATLQDIACQGVLKGLGVQSIQCGQVGGLPAVESLAKAPHVLGHGEVANPHLTQVPVEIAAKSIEQPLPQEASLIARPVKPAHQQHKVKDDQIEAALHSVGHPIMSIKCGLSGLRHDHAIQRSDGAALGTAPKRS